VNAPVFFTSTRTSSASTSQDRERLGQEVNGRCKDTLTLWNGLWLDLHIQDSFEHERWVVRHDEENKVRMESEEARGDNNWPPDLRMSRWVIVIVICQTPGFCTRDQRFYSNMFVLKYDQTHQTGRAYTTVAPKAKAAGVG
jgi:hypothetical protein